MEAGPLARFGHSGALRAKLGLVLGDLHAAGWELVRHPQADEVYAEYLFASHCIVRASVPLLETAWGAALERPGDPVAAQLAAYLGEHIEEEQGHDEWLLEDLEVLGTARADVLARPPTPTVAAFVGAQYYWVLHADPIAIMGYIALLEGYPPQPALIEALIASTGHPRAAFRCMIGHGTLDPHHREEFEAALDTMALTPAQETLVGLSAMASVTGMARVVRELLGQPTSRSVPVSGSKTNPRT